MTNEQKKGLKSFLQALGVIAIIIGAVTNLYDVSLGIVMALALWLLSGPVLKMAGLYPQREGEGTGGEQATAAENKPGFSKGKLLAMLIIGALLTMWAVSFAFSRGSGVLASENRAVAGFDTIEISGSGTLVIEQSGNETLRIEADDNLIDRIETKVEGRTLKIRTTTQWLAWSFWPREDVTYYLTVDDLKKVSVSGSAEISSEMLEADSFEVRISGSGNVDMTLVVTALLASVSGSGEFNFDGSARQQEIEINGSGKYYAKDLESQSASIDISGSGEGVLNASDTLKVEISGSGRVEYLGSPAIDQSISGSGSIRQYIDSGDSETNTNLNANTNAAVNEAANSNGAAENSTTTI